MGAEKETKKGSSSEEPEPSGGTALPKDRPAETLTAAAGVVAAGVTQLLDVENAAVIGVLVALVGLIPAFVTWLVEIGKKWDDAAGGAVASPAGEAEYLQGKLLREASICIDETEKRRHAIEKILTTFRESQPQDGEGE